MENESRSEVLDELKFLGARMGRVLVGLERLQASIDAGRRAWSPAIDAVEATAREAERFLAREAAEKAVARIIRRARFWTRLKWALGIEDPPVLIVSATDPPLYRPSPPFLRRSIDQVAKDAEAKIRADFEAKIRGGIA